MQEVVEEVALVAVAVEEDDAEAAEVEVVEVVANPHLLRR